jgi:hypothetical protein
MCFISTNILTVLANFLGSIIQPVLKTLQAMTNDSDLNMGNNIGKRDTQFFGMFWLKILEN